MSEPLDTSYQLYPGAQVPIKAWTRGVPFEPGALAQVQRLATMPFVHKWVAVMPDVHVGIGATIGSVIATHKAIIPAAVGVDIGCGMMAVKTSLTASELPDRLAGLRRAVERSVPHGSSPRKSRDVGAWGDVPAGPVQAWRDLEPGYRRIIERHPKLDRGAHVSQLGTLGGGNHFIEICLDQADQIWFMLHSGSRGVGNRIGTYFIEKARHEMERNDVHLPDRDLAYLAEGSALFDDYVHAVRWSQGYARENRELMMRAMVDALRRCGELPEFTAGLMAVNCHHNYVTREHHYGEDVLVTRKGAVRAGRGDFGIIPGSMGARSFIVRGLGNPESFESCSHGAGRVMSRTEAKRRISVEQHALATEGIECRKDAGVVDESPAAYKSIDDVMRAQADLVEIVHTLRQVMCVKG